MTTPIFQSAIDRGLCIIPIPPREKGTKLDRWPERATNDATIMEGLDGWNYGVVANDEFCILDIDNPEAFRNELGVKLPSTYTVKTSRGLHLYFRHTDRSRKLGSKGAGIFDFQADRKYVVGEGSTHPSGHVYTCVDSSPIIEIPDALVAALDRYVGERKRERARLGLKAGDRQDMLNYAGSIYTAEITEEEMLEKLIERNETHSEEPLSLGDLQRIVQSAFKSWEYTQPSLMVVVGSPKLEHEKVVGSRSDFVLGPHGGERHGVFARGAFHLIQGSSGVGKTTIGIQMLRAQQQRKWFFDREGQGRPFFIIWQDRSKLELERQLENMHMLEDPPPFHATSSDEAQRDPAKVIEAILLAQPVRPEVLLVEGIDLWCLDAKDMKHVGTLATAIRDVAEHYHVAIRVRERPAGAAGPRDRCDHQRE